MKKLKILLNPFEKIAGWPALFWGLLPIPVFAWIFVFSNFRSSGGMAGLSWYGEMVLLALIPWILLSAAYFALGRAFSRAKISLFAVSAVLPLASADCGSAPLFPCRGAEAMGRAVHADSNAGFYEIANRRVSSGLPETFKRDLAGDASASGMPEAGGDGPAAGLFFSAISSGCSWRTEGEMPKAVLSIRPGAAGGMFFAALEDGGGMDCAIYEIREVRFSKGAAEILMDGGAKLFLHPSGDGGKSFDCIQADFREGENRRAVFGMVLSGDSRASRRGDDFYEGFLDMGGGAREKMSLRMNSGNGGWGIFEIACAAISDSPVRIRRVSYITGAAPTFKFGFSASKAGRVEAEAEMVKNVRMHGRLEFGGASRPFELSRRVKGREAKEAPFPRGTAELSSSAAAGLADPELPLFVAWASLGVSGEALDAGALSAAFGGPEFFRAVYSGMDGAEADAFRAPYPGMEPVRIFAKAASVSSDGKTVSVSFCHPDPAIAARVANLSAGELVRVFDAPLGGAVLKVEAPAKVPEWSVYR